MLLSHPAAWDTVHSNEMIRWNENIIYTQCCDVWRVTGCVTRHISIRCETRGMGYVITTLHSPHSLTQTVSQPASSPALTLRMSKCQFHFILFYENWRTLLCCIPRILLRFHFTTLNYPFKVDTLKSASHDMKTLSETRLNGNLWLRDCECQSGPGTEWAGSDNI